MFKLIVFVAVVVVMIETEAKPHRQGVCVGPFCDPPHRVTYTQDKCSDGSCPKEWKCKVENYTDPATGCTKCRCKHEDPQYESQCGPAVAPCPMDDCITKVIVDGNTGCSKCICDPKESKNQMPIMIIGDQGCKKRKSCKGVCINSDEECHGEKDPKGCKGKHCVCCTTQRVKRKLTKPKASSTKEVHYKRSKNGQECKKKKSCKGFCINSDEECLGEKDPKGCKGKHCVCCTQGDKGSTVYVDNNNYDYSTSNYGQNCFGKNVNGSCEDRGCFICGDGQCWPPEFKCDQITDCKDGSDERNCSHSMSGFPTWYSPETDINQAEDCPDGTDEFNCPRPKPDGHKPGSATGTFPIWYSLETNNDNQLKNCTGSSDELDCLPSMPDGHNPGSGNGALPWMMEPRPETNNNNHDKDCTEDSDDVECPRPKPDVHKPGSASGSFPWLVPPIQQTIQHGTDNNNQDKMLY